jgi:hypothetical protein
VVGDYRPVLEETGFDVLSSEQIPNWREPVAAGFGAANFRVANFRVANFRVECAR